MPRIRRADVPPLARDLPPAAPGRPADVICVVVPARDASATLPALLDALAAQTLAPDEVVVVDDGSADGTARVAAAAGVRVVASGRVGPGPARNLGAAATTAPLIAFTDADCAPAPDWLERGVAALGRLDLVQGRVTPPPGVPVGRYDRTVWVDRLPGGVRRDRGAVDRPDRGAQDDVGRDPPLDERAEHADLVGAEVAASAEDEGGVGSSGHARREASPRIRRALS